MKLLIALAIAIFMVFNTITRPAATPSLHFVGRIIDSFGVVASDPFWKGITDSSQYGPMGFLYAPALIYLKEGQASKFHLFTCAAYFSNVPNQYMDLTRYAFSDTGRYWSTSQRTQAHHYPNIQLVPTDRTMERSVCDPSVVYYKNFYYLFYSGNRQNSRQTLMFVARSPRIVGPYQRYIGNHQWESVSNDPNSHPQPIIEPLAFKQQGYGAGQQSVVVKDDRFFSWYTDDSLTSEREPRIYFTTSSDGIHWDKSQLITVSDRPFFNMNSVDVKYDPLSKTFRMFYINSHEDQPMHRESTYLARRSSSDGIHWSAEEVLCDAQCFPNFAHNVGVSGDRQGHLIPHQPLLISYAAPNLDADESINRQKVFTITDKAWQTTIQSALYIHSLGDLSAPGGYFTDPIWPGEPSTFYSPDRKTYCRLITASHLQMHAVGRENVPQIGHDSTSHFGRYTGTCEKPSGYFAWFVNAPHFQPDTPMATYYSNGNGTYCVFPTEAELHQHVSQRRYEPRFGTIDPTRLLTFVGTCKSDKDRK